MRPKVTVTLERMVKRSAIVNLLFDALPLGIYSVTTALNVNGNGWANIMVVCCRIVINVFETYLCQRVTTKLQCKKGTSQLHKSLS